MSRMAMSAQRNAATIPRLRDEVFNHGALEVVDALIVEEVSTMRWLTKRFGRTAATPPLPPAAELCPHTTLVPKWESLAEMGQDDKASGYTCQGCQRTFTAAEGRDLLRTEGERLARLQKDVEA
jgi:hypothetical protein